MERLQRLLNQGGMGGGGGGPGAGDAPQQDTAETVYISSLALLKMLKHGRAGVPLEVMGLMLGEFVDEYTVKVVDVFAMPQVRGGGRRAAAPAGALKFTRALPRLRRRRAWLSPTHTHPRRA